MYLFKGVVKLLAVVNKLPLFAFKFFFNLLQLTFKLFLAANKKKLKKGTKINETKSTFKKSSFISNLKKVLCVDIVLCRNLDLKT